MERRKKKNRLYTEFLITRLLSNYFYPLLWGKRKEIVYFYTSVKRQKSCVFFHVVESCSVHLQIFLIQNKIRRCMHFSGRIRWCCANRDHATECYQWAHLPSYRIADVMKFSCRGSSADTIPTFSTRECTVDQRAKIRYSKQTVSHAWTSLYSLH